jgi:carbamoyltransferase
MIIVGINAFHGDASACILSDGKIVAAAEEERFRRVKHWAGFPSEAVRYCLSQANVTISDVSHVAVNSDPSANLMRKVRFALRSRPDPQMLFDRMVNQARRQSIERELAKAFPGNRFKGKIDRVEHHLSHLASAYLASPFNDAVVISIDGFGDFSSAAWGIGQSNRIDVLGRVHFPHSLGIFYQALTQFLGFPNYGDEYKVMGLAPYGKPRLLDKMRQIVTLREDGTFALNMSYFRHATEKIAYEWASGSPHVGKLFSTMLENLLGPARKPEHGIEQRHCDIASSVQGMYEEAFFHLINSLHRQYGVDSLALAGGCAMNSVANGKVLRQSPYTRLYVQPAAGDAGGAVGAALSIWNRVSSKSGRAEENNWPVALEGDNVPNRCIMEHAYLGPEASAQEIAELLTSRAAEIDAGGCEVRWLTDEADLCMKAAKAISIGAVVGWFQGRMEWGPRALGRD